MLGENAKWLLVVAVDSYSDGLRLNGLNDDRRLFSKETQFGFIPGEAAGVLLLAPEGGSRWAAVRGTHFTLVGAGDSIDPVTERQENETLFNAMSDSTFAACEMAFSTGCFRRISHWYADCSTDQPQEDITPDGFGADAGVVEGQLFGGIDRILRPASGCPIELVDVAPVLVEKDSAALSRSVRETTMFLGIASSPSSPPAGVPI